MPAVLARVVALAAAAVPLSGCLVTAVISKAYFESSGGSDHEARVDGAWSGPDDGLVLALAELEGVWSRSGATLVLRPEELEQAFRAPLPPPGTALPVPHVGLPRAVLERRLAPPPPDALEAVRAEPWEPPREERSDERPLAFPEPRPGERWLVHWLHGYRPGLGDETGFALLVTRSEGGRVRRALLVPERFEPPAWIGVLAGVTIALDVLLIALLVA